MKKKDRNKIKKGDFNKTKKWKGEGRKRKRAGKREVKWMSKKYNVEEIKKAPNVYPSKVRS